MGYEWTLGWRLVRPRRRGFVSFIAGAAMLGLALGVAALVVVLSVVNGFEREVRDRLLSALPHVEVLALPGAGAMQALAEATPALRARPEVQRAAPFLRLPALLGHGDQLRAAQLLGQAPGAAAASRLVDELPAALRETLQPGSRRVLLGRELARELGARTGDALTLVRPGGEPGAPPRLLALQLAGTFESGHHSIDAGLALMHPDDLRALAGADAEQGLALQLRDPLAARAVAATLRNTLDPGLRVSDWSRTMPNWFESVQISKRMIGLMLLLIVAVAAFNLTATLVMTVADRRADIAILRTLGASPASVMAVFMLQGAISGVIGTLGGLALGLAAVLQMPRIGAAIEALAGRPLIDARIYFIDHLPAQARAGEVALVCVLSIALAFVASAWPAWRAARVDPANALRTV
ncbi:MAG: FtsX-like permease family protein [Rubrivivax sp.]